MGFFRKDRWVDSGVLDWTPDKPFGREPRIDEDSPGWRDVESRPDSFDRLEPVFAPPAAEPIAEQPAPIEPEPDFDAAIPTPRLQAEPEAAPEVIDATPQVIEAAPQPKPQAQHATEDAIGEVQPRSPRLWLPRVTIGLAQGVLLFALLQSRDLNHFPGNDGYLFSALALAGLFAPLLLLEGLGDIALPALALWSGIAATALASVGLYHHWRLQTGEQVHAGLGLIALMALALVIAQSWLRAGLSDKKLLPAYRTCFDASWTLAARLLVWAGIVLVAWAAVGSASSFVTWLRAQNPELHFSFDATQLTLPVVGVAGACAFALTAGTSWTRRLTRKSLLACFTIALPVLIVWAVALVFAATAAPQPLWQSLSCGALLLIAINASYRAGGRRVALRRGCETVGAVLLVGLAVAAVLSLHARVDALGWTHIRIYAALATAMLGLYGAAYSAAILIGIGGGRWMQRIEIANRTLAALLVAGCVLLCTPLADPLELAVKAQMARLAAGADPATFDFAWLKQEGVRFGRGALGDMTHSARPEVARDAAVTLATTPDNPAPPPSQIGANITVRTPGARLPSSLLNRDWSAVADAPPCLTKAALACDAWFLDLDRDGTAEILLVYGSDARWWASAMKQRARGWVPAASFASPACRGTLSAMRKGDLYMTDPAPTWQDILVAGFRLTAKPAPKPELPCPK